MCLFIVCGVLLVGTVRSQPTGGPNFVFVLTDDQDLLLNGLMPMEKTLKLVANEGVTFEHAFVNTPICCPSRSTILTGKYVHNLKVFNNSLSGNCSSLSWQRTHEKNSIANLLKINKDYTTFYAGKYLNQYGDKKAGGFRQPPGYDWWIGLAGNSKYYNYSLSINGSRRDYTDEYLTDVISDFAIDFLNQKHVSESPFFMMIAPPACHAPFTPAKRHVDAFKGTKALRTPSFNHTSSDKHWLVQMAPNYLPTDVQRLDEIQQLRMETLLSVDELVERIIKKLEELSILDDTYVIFTSDNGFHIGQFTQPWDKRQPYETDVKIPFFIRGPKIKRKSLSPHPISSIDILPTILDLASVDIPEDVDGTSLKPHLFKNPIRNENARVFIEYFGESSEETIDKYCRLPSNDLSYCALENWCKCQDSRNNTYACVKIIGRFENFKYCQFDDDLGFVEAYDLISDPYELRNIQLDAKDVLYYGNLLRKFRNNEN